MTNTISGWARGWISSLLASGLPRSSAFALARNPRTGASAPAWARSAREVTPSFQPASGPAASRASPWIA